MTYATKLSEVHQGQTTLWTVEIADLFTNLATYGEVSDWLNQERIVFKIKNINTLEFHDEEGAALFYLRYAGGPDVG